MSRKNVDTIFKAFIDECSGMSMEDLQKDIPPDHPLFGFPASFLPPNFLPPTDLGGMFKLPVDMPENLPLDEGMKYYDVSKSKPNFIPWLNIKNEPYVPRNRNDYGLFTMLSQNKYHEGIWNMVQYSMPVYLSNKYHIVNIKKLMENTTSSNYMSLATYYCMFNEILGIPYLKIIDDFRTELIKCNKSSKKTDKKLRKWISSVDSMIRDMKMTLVGGAICKVTPELDLCHSASEFLLEPCIIIQLPWKPVILNQWLHATLTEILRFEINSAEFRYWPIKNDKVRKIVNELLSLVKNLKERILLGFAIINEKIKIHPENDSKLADVIMDQVVLPSSVTIQVVLL